MMSVILFFNTLKSGQGEKYEIIERGVALALLTTFTLASEAALRMSRIKPTKLQFCTPMIIMGFLAQ